MTIILRLWFGFRPNADDFNYDPRLGDTPMWRESWIAIENITDGSQSTPSQVMENFNNKVDVIIGWDKAKNSYSF